MNKRQAAEFLGVSDRAINRYVASGKLAVRYEKRPRGHQVGVYDPADLERLKLRLESPPPRPPAESTGQSKALARRVASEELAAAIIQLTTTARTTVPLDRKLTLSLAGAVELSGYSEEFLLDAIKRRALKAGERDGGLNIKRRDLEKWIRKL